MQKLRPSEEIRQQIKDLEDFAPQITWENIDQSMNEHGEVVSISVTPRQPDGVIFSVATKTKLFGPFSLTQVAAQQLLARLELLSSNSGAQTFNRFFGIAGLPALQNQDTVGAFRRSLFRHVPFFLLVCLQG